MGRLIAIVDDEKDILELVRLHLERAGFDVEVFTTAGALLSWLHHNEPELIILDIMLPDADGFDVCKNLKRDDRYSHVPVIMLTALDAETDRVLGLEIGADDYVTKPFSPRELVARVKAVLRRGKAGAEPEEKIEIGKAITIDPARFEVIVRGKRVELTPTEFRILSLLASRRGWVFSRERILQHLWGNEKVVVDRTIDVHIRHIREKLGKDADIIKNIRGMGYKLEVDDE